MTDRKEHCAFKVLDHHTGKCIAYCIHNDYETDCIGNKRLTPTEMAKAQAEERKLL